MKKALADVLVENNGDAERYKYPILPAPTTRLPR